MTCTHERWEKIAAADGGDPGGCPICMSEENERLRSIILGAHATFRTGSCEDDETISVLMAKILEEGLGDYRPLAGMDHDNLILRPTAPLAFADAKPQNGFVVLAWYPTHQCWQPLWYRDGATYTATHWLPMPEPPESEILHELRTLHS